MAVASVSPCRTVSAGTNLTLRCSPRRIDHPPLDTGAQRPFNIRRTTAIGSLGFFEFWSLVPSQGLVQDTTNPKP